MTHNVDDTLEQDHKVYHPFDSLFKSFMSKPSRAIDFCSLFLPQEIWSLVQKNEFVLCPQSMVDNKLKHKHVDVLYRTKFKNAPGYIYFLTEEQTEPDKNMPLRLWQYILRIIEQHQKQFEVDTFPIVYPIVFSVGKKPYSFPTDFFDGFGEHKALAKSILTNPFLVADVVGVDEDALRDHPLAGALSQIYQIAYARDVVAILKKLRHQIRYMDISGDSDFVVSMLHFTLDRAEKGDAEAVIKTVQQIVSKKTENNIMTLADQLRNKGMQQGIQQGMQQGMRQGMQQEKYLIAKNLLSMHTLAFEEIARVTGLPVDVIKQLKNKLESEKQ